MTLTLGISPCPNDTFAFHALIHGLAGELDVRTELRDVEALNRMAEDYALDVVKISVAAYGRLRERYALLRSGGAAGYGTGPIVVARDARDVGGRVAVPGTRTTAALLLRQLGSFETVAMPFGRIEDAVLAGDVDCGVLIHEGRFTYEQRGLTLLQDLGLVWEERTELPVPLGAIAIRRELGVQVAERVERAVHASVVYAREHPAASADYVRMHAQELDAEVCRRHIELYVNDYTLDLDAGAVERLLHFGAEQGAFPVSATPVFLT